MKLEEKNKEKEFKLYKRHYKKYLHKKDIILDFGCGVGKFLYFLEKSGYTNFIGIDKNEKAIALAKKISNKAEYVPNSERYLDQHQNYFDVIVLNEVLEHIKKDRILMFLFLIKNSLKNNGKLFIRTINADCPISSSTRYIDFEHEISFTKESLTQILFISGFKKVKVIQERNAFLIEIMRLPITLFFKIVGLSYGKNVITSKKIICFAS